MNELTVPDPVTLHRQIITIQALTGQPYPACKRAALAYAWGLDALIDSLKAGTITVTAAGEVVSTGYNPYPTEPSGPTRP